MAITYRVKRIGFDADVREFIRSHHYSQATPNQSVYCFGLFDGNQRIGVCLFSRFSRNQAAKKYYGCIELSRLYVIDGTPKNTESFFIGHCLREIRKEKRYRGVVSYADPNVGHHGTIYRASNFKVLGETAKSYHYLDHHGNRVHIRSVWGRAKTNGVSERDQAKDEGLIRVNDNPKIIYFYPLSNEKSGSVNEYRWKLMTNWSRESAWLHGLIIGDGHITDSGRIWFGGNKDTVTKFRKLLCIDKAPEFKRGIYHTYFNYKRLAEWFRSNGVGKRKKDELRYPDVPEKYKWDFLRGLIDTDGTFRVIDPKKWSGRGRKQYSLGFTSANREFCQRVANEMDCTSSVIESNKNLNGTVFSCYSFKLGKNKTIEVLRKVYDCPKEIRNEERYRKHLENERLIEKYESYICRVCDEQGVVPGYCWKHMMARKRKEKSRLQCSVEECKKPPHVNNGPCMEHMFAQKRESEAEWRNPETGKRIREIRKTMKITQKRFGEMIGLPQTEVSRLEINQKKMTPELASSIARALECDQSEFMPPQENR